MAMNLINPEDAEDEKRSIKGYISTQKRVKDEEKNSIILPIQRWSDLGDLYIIVNPSFQQ